MASARVFTMDGAESGSIELNPAVFDVEMKPALVHAVVKALRNAQRQGNAETKTRGYISGGGRKPYRQKGTGNARHGSTREPQMRGGGTVFGPHRRDYRQRVPKEWKVTALRCVLSDRARQERLTVLDAFTLETPRTKPVAQLLTRIDAGSRRTLVVTAEVEPRVLLSTRNIPGVRTVTAADLNVLDLAQAARILILRDALTTLEARLS